MKLENNEAMQFLEELTTNMEIDAKELSSGVMKLPVYRTLYLEKMLKSLDNVAIQRDSTYQNMIQQLENNGKTDEIQLPMGLQADLRNYQKVGYQWLKTLDDYHFGGILADDMGLRKNDSSIGSYFILC